MKNVWWHRLNYYDMKQYYPSIRLWNTASDKFTEKHESANDSFQCKYKNILRGKVLTMILDDPLKKKKNMPNLQCSFLWFFLEFVTISTSTTKRKQNIRP